ncbi:MAG: DUF493 domain-containing protein [Bacteroidota bacterium]
MKDDQINALKAKLEAESWPMVYMFKFIIPDDNHKLALVEGLFGAEAVTNIRKSRNGNYLSVTGKEMMLSADEVIAKYRKAATIEGLIAL